MRVVLDTCILKLATFPGENNASAFIFELARAGLIEAWVSPAILEEYADVLGDQYQAVNVMRPGEFLNLPEVGRLVKKLLRG